MLGSSGARIADLPQGLGWMIPGPASPTWVGPASVSWLGALTSEATRRGIGFCHLGADPAGIARLPVLAPKALQGAGPRDLFVTVPSGAGPTGLGAFPTDRNSPEPARGGSVRLHLELPFAVLRRPEGRAWVRELQEALRVHRIASWGVGLDTAGGPEPDEIEEMAASSSWLRVPLHLLASAERVRFVGSQARRGRPVYASDPFASGRLDGSFLSESYLEKGPGSRAPEVARLQAEWAPVLRLGFLTEGGRRTLPGAALAFLREQPGVRGVFAEAADTAALARIATAWTAPALIPEEIRRLEGLQA